MFATLGAMTFTKAPHEPPLDTTGTDTTNVVRRIPCAFIDDLLTQEPSFRGCMFYTWQWCGCAFDIAHSDNVIFDTRCDEIFYFKGHVVQVVAGHVDWLVRWPYMVVLYSNIYVSMFSNVSMSLCLEMPLPCLCYHHVCPEFIFNICVFRMTKQILLLVFQRHSINA